jgi:hypothetical protein
MATVIGTQTSEQAKEKSTVLKGSAILQPGDDVLQIDIPLDHQAPTGRRLRVSWQLTIREEDDT